MSASPVDVVIVGGGIIGLSTALELVQRGFRVCVVDQQAMGREASWAGGGILSELPPGHIPAGLEDLLTQSLDIYPRFCEQLHESTGIDPEFWRCGMDYFEGAKTVCYPHIAQVRNPRLIKALLALLVKEGVILRPRSRVLSVQTRANHVTGVITDVGPIPSAAVVICAGAWSATFAGAAVRPIKGQMLLLRGIRGLLDRILMNSKVYVVPRRDGSILVGSTLEDVGFNHTPTESARNWLYQEALKLVPAMRGLPIEHHWAGLRPRPAGEMPLIQPDQVQKGLYLNTGHYRLGITLAPASAIRTAQMLTEDHL